MTNKEMQRAVFVGTLRAHLTFGGMVIIGAVLLRLVIMAIQF